MKKMITVLKSGDNRNRMESLLKQINAKAQKKGIDTKKYLGKVVFKDDALTIQKGLRDEWN